MFYLLIILIGLIDAGSAILLRIWANDHKPITIVIGILLYGLVGLFFALSLQYKGLAIANVLCVSSSTVLLTLLAVMVFKESLSGWQIMGMFIIFIGVTILNYFTK